MRAPLPLPALAAALALAGCGAAAAPPSILLVTLDTTRADRIGAYGYADAGTPALDALAARGLLVERAIAPVPLTLPSHTSLMTGLEPPVHGVRDNSVFQVPADASTLAEELAAAGWRTAAFVSAYPLDGVFGLDQGFEHYDDQLGVAGQEAVGAMHERRGDRTTDRALRWLDDLDPDEPFFAWVHLFDPHYPLTPPEPFAGRFPADPYQAEISFADAQVGRLVERLAERGRGDGTLVVVTSDHGESLGEFGEVSHGNLLYDGTQRVPLVLAGPGVAAGVTLPGPAGLTDVTATLRAFAGLPPGAGDGVPLALDGVSDPGGRAAYLETVYPRLHFGWSELFALEREGWKVVLAPGVEGGGIELWRAGEERPGGDLTGDEPEVAARLAADLARWRDELAARALGGDATPAAEADLEALEALGYTGVDVEVDLDAGVPGRDPRDVVGASVASNLMRTALSLGDKEAAAFQLARIVELDPGGILEHESRGFVELARGLAGGRDDAALGRAKAAFERALELAPGRRGLWQRLAEVRLALDEPEPAYVAARHAASLAPPTDAIETLLTTLRTRLGHERDAARARGEDAEAARLEALLAE